MTGVKALQSHFMSLSDNLKDDAPVATFKRTFSQDMDLQEKQLTKEILHETDCKTALTKLRSLFENTFNSDLRLRLQNYTAFETIFIKDMIIGDMDFIKKYMIEIILHQQEIQQLLNEKKLQTQEDQSNKVQALNVDSFKFDLVVIQNTCFEKEDNNSTKCIQQISKGKQLGFCNKRYVDTFTSTMLLNVDQLQNQLNNDEFQEDGSMAAFWVVNNQFQKFIDSQFSLDYNSQMTDKYFAEYTRIKVKQFRETLLQHMSNVKKSVAERTRHQRQYDKRVNKRQMRKQESMVDMGKAVDADLVIIESSRTESEVQDDSSMSENDTDADDADIRPIYDEEPMAKCKSMCIKERNYQCECEVLLLQESFGFFTGYIHE
ncbi:hypothetical protein Tco_0320271 [Tanacetum coccineum]